MGDENGNLDYERYYPSKQFQLLWIQEYLRGINNGEGKNDDPSQAEVTEYEIGERIFTGSTKNTEEIVLCVRGLTC